MIYEPKHRSDLKGKKILDREVVHAVEFGPNGPFYAVSAAEVYLKDLGYSVGIISGDNPIGFIYGGASAQRWGDLTPDEKKMLDGAIMPMPRFRDGGALIVFFTPPRY